jgi:peptidoglycan/LPS O-acetylase OafA/YrhL
VRRARPRIAPLTGVRAFAALWVVFYHLLPTIEGMLPEAHGLHAFLAFGYLGVDLFAFLSGFVIAYNYHERVDLRRPREIGVFLWIRAVRVFPLHLFLLLSLLLARLTISGFGEFGIDVGRWEAGDFLQHALMVHGWGVAQHLSWNVPSWTVSSEWLCYLLFPLMAVLLSRIGDGSVALAAATATLGATKIVLDATGFPDFSASLSWGAVRIGGEFLAGCLLWRAFASGAFDRAPWGAIAVGAFGTAGLLTRWPGSAFPIVCSFAVGVLALAYARGPLAWFLALRPIVFLGEISYSIYLLHWVVLRIFEYTVGRAVMQVGGRGLALAVMVGVILGGSVLTYFSVERPARRHLRGWVTAPPTR